MKIPQIKYELYIAEIMYKGTRYNPYPAPHMSALYFQNNMTNIN